MNFQVTPRLIPFGVFELDFHAAELRRAGARLNLPTQSFQVLLLLLERPGDPVTREEWVGVSGRMARSSTSIMA